MCIIVFSFLFSNNVEKHLSFILYFTLLELSVFVYNASVIPVRQQQTKKKKCHHSSLKYAFLTSVFYLLPITAGWFKHADTQ